MTAGRSIARTAGTAAGAIFAFSGVTLALEGGRNIVVGLIDWEWHPFLGGLWAIATGVAMVVMVLKNPKEPVFWLGAAVFAFGAAATAAVNLPEGQSRNGSLPWYLMFGFILVGLASSAVSVWKVHRLRTEQNLPPRPSQPTYPMSSREPKVYR